MLPGPNDTAMPEDLAGDRRPSWPDLVESSRWSAAAFSSAGTLIAILYPGLGAGAWYLCDRGVAGSPAAVVGRFSSFSPLVGGVPARLFLHERPSVRLVVGGR